MPDIRDPCPRIRIRTRTLSHFFLSGDNENSDRSAGLEFEKCIRNVVLDGLYVLVYLYPLPV